MLRRLIRKCAYLKYVEARLGDRILYADEILRDGFCINMLDTPLCPLKVVTNLQEAVWDADIVINGLPSTETRPVFEEIGRYWKERRSVPVIISLAKGVETSLIPVPHITTPTQMIHEASKSFFGVILCSLSKKMCHLHTFCFFLAMYRFFCALGSFLVMHHFYYSFCFSKELYQLHTFCFPKSRLICTQSAFLKACHL